MGTTVDWNRWLPPLEIRNYGDLEFKPGQVWAWRYDDDPIVFRVLEYGRGRDASVRVDGLAREKFDGESPIAMRAAGCYVLVQDVGQREPAPPDALWQEAYALPPDLCYAPDICTSVRVMGRDEHGKAYCWKHRALWGTVTREVANEQTMANMGRALAASMDKSMMDAFQSAGLFLNEGPAPRRLTPGDQVWLSADGLIRAPCDGRPDCKCDRVMVGCAVSKKGDDVVWVSAASGARGLMAFKLGAPHEWNLSALVDHSTDTDFHGNPKALAVPMGTFSNLLAPMKPLTADSILEAMKSMDAIKTRDAETKKRYDDIVMSGLAGPAKRLRTYDEILAAPMAPPAWTRRSYRPLFVDLPRTSVCLYVSPEGAAPCACPPGLGATMCEQHASLMTDKANEKRRRVDLFPVIRKGAPRTQSQSIAAGLGVWGTRGDAKLPPEPKPYPHVSDEDLLPDAGR